MVQKCEKVHRENFKNHIRADIIILGGSLPGIVTAHNLKKKFGNTVDIVVLDQTSVSNKVRARKTGISVAFEEIPDDIDDDSETPPKGNSSPSKHDNVARFFLEKYSTDFSIPIPCSLEPQKLGSSLHKLFQDMNGSTVPCMQNYHEFDYLSFIERFEMLQYQTLLDRSMQNLFHQYDLNTEADKKRLMYFDQTTMEQHLSKGLSFSTSQAIMRTIVEIVCGTSADKISVLFYLHQCYRVSSSSNLIDGDNARFVEKLTGHFLKRLHNKLQHSIADITVTTKPIIEIRTSPDEQVILEPAIGETDYICDLLAMAIQPDQLRDIVMETKLATEEEIKLVTDMEQGEALKFIVEYETNFWQPLGYSGDILSIRGPIIWAMERQLISTTRSSDKYVALIGYLKVSEDKHSSREKVLDQLVKLFGPEAANPVSYTEIPIRKIYIPQLGHFVGLRKLICESCPKHLEWGTLDIFADGDVAAALEAGQAAYIHLLSILRPQALNYDDVACGVGPTNLYSSVGVFTASLNVMSTSRYILFGLVIIIALRFARSALRR